jgi:hypothetical protein
MAVEPAEWTDYSTVLRPADFATNFSSGYNVMGMSVNLNDNVTADMTVHYDFASFGWDSTFLPVSINLFV